VPIGELQLHGKKSKEGGQSTRQLTLALAGRANAPAKFIISLACARVDAPGAIDEPI
jgi:hypothetical protein